MKMIAHEDVSGKDTIENENRCTHGLISVFLNERAINLISFDLDKHQEQVNFFCWEMLWSVVDPPVDPKRNLDYSMTQRGQTGTIIKPKLGVGSCPRLRKKNTKTWILFKLAQFIVSDNSRTLLDYWHHISEFHWLRIWRIIKVMQLACINESLICLSSSWRGRDL
mgnify:FL=1